MKPKLRIDLRGQDDNIFVVIGRAAEILKRSNKRDEANEMKNRVIKQKSHASALKVINEYVQLIETKGRIGYASEPLFEEVKK